MPPLADAAHQPPQRRATGRVAVSSAANLLLVSLLRFNHVLAPAIVRALRKRRSNWVERVTDDVEAELRRDPKSRQLCAGVCCQRAYGTFDNARDDDSSELSVLDWAKAVATSSALESRPTAEIAQMADFVEDVLTGDAHSGARLRSEAEIYFALRVQQEARHRRNKPLRALDERVVLTWLTLCGVVVYGGAIVAGVQYWYRLCVWELGVFAWSLLTTAVLVEAHAFQGVWRALFASGGGTRELEPRGVQVTTDKHVGDGVSETFKE